MKIPCSKDCKDRNESCHATCEKYITWSTAREEERTRRFKESNLDHQITGVEIARRDKRRRRMNK